MDGLILLIVILPVIFLILLISILNRTGEQRRLLKDLYNKVTELGTEISRLSPGPQDKPVTPSIQREVVIPKYTPPPVVDTPIETPVEKIEVAEPGIPIVTHSEAAFVEEQSFDEVTENVRAAETPRKKKTSTDIEKFIGENLANKIGITILVLGIGFFIKYAIDKNWIGEAGRVIIGLICGGVLIGFAHYLRNTYRSFSSVLVGGGLSVFYFSVAFAFHEYGLISQTAAFIFMVIISGLGVLLSLYYNRQELAILATIGAFITPFLVSTGKENHVALFTYLCIVNAGLMVLSWFKRWPAINSIALFFTTFIFGGWIIKHTLFDDDITLPLKDALQCNRGSLRPITPGSRSW